jgi:uncharacterized BrkB/YihY/UPF0761 family membrane protein
MLYWMLATLAFFAMAMALAQPAYRNWRKAGERLLLAAIWPLVLLLLICWAAVLLVYAIAKRVSRRE